MSFSLFLVMAAVAIATAAADVPSVPIPHPQETVSDAILEISYSDISRVYQGDWILVIYAPWCGYCQRLMDDMPAIVNALQGVAKVAKIDGTEYDAVRFQFGVDGYPSIYRLHNGEVWAYDGTHDPNDIVKFARTQWENMHPLTGWNSPTSFFVRVASAYVNFVSPAVTITENAGKHFGVAPEMIVVIVTSCILVVIVAVGYFFIRRKGTRRQPSMRFLCDPAKIKEN